MIKSQKVIHFLSNLTLFLMTFLEFLSAVGETPLRHLLEEMDKPLALTDLFHEQLLKLLKYYFIVGGMPEVIATFLQDENLERVRLVQKEISDETANEEDRDSN